MNSNFPLSLCTTLTDSPLLFYQELYRPKSLLETHAENYVKSRKWKDDDASKRAFDREKDVLGTRRMDLRKRKEFLDNAKGLSSKFGHGKHGSFL